MGKYSKEELDNHANQLNPNNEAYWSSRGYNDDDDFRNSNDNDEYLEDGRIIDWFGEDFYLPDDE